MPQLADLWITLTSAIIIYTTMHGFESAVQPLLFKSSRRKDNETEDMLLFKSKKAAHNLFMFFWHSFSTIGLIYCVKGKAWTPSYMMGSGTFTSGFPNMPFSPIDEDCYIFGLIIMGHPVQQALMHFTKKERNPDFAEMSLHHLAHLSLASCYIFTNVLPVGTLVALCHEFNDVFVQLARVLHLTNYTPLAMITILIGQLGWLYGRIYCLPYLTWELHNDVFYGPERAHLQPFLTFSVLFLVVLIILHIYWFFLFQLFNFRVLMKGSFDVADTQNDITKMKRKEK